jgi:hypothetical protein
MGSVQFTDAQTRPTEFLDLTSLTLDEFQHMVPPFEAAFQAHMTAWRLDGKPRTARQFAVYKNCPLPTPEDWLLFILAYIKTYALQVVQGRLFGMGQSKANRYCSGTPGSSSFPGAKRLKTMHNRLHDTTRHTYPRRYPCHLPAGRRSRTGPGGGVDCPHPQPPGTG